MSGAVQMSEEELVVKVDLEGDVRRLRARLPPKREAGEEARYAALQATIVEGFKLPEGSPHLVLKYRDEEEDLCTLVEATLADFLQGASGRGPLKLVASRASAPDAAAPADQPAAPAQAAAQSRLNPEAPAFVQQSPAQDGNPPVNVLANAVVQALTGSLPGGAYSGTRPEPEKSTGGIADGFVPGIASQSCRSVGPQKLLACLAGLHHAGRLSSRMISSLVLQFLPILAQRAHRKQEKINRIGGQHRDMVLPLLKKALAGAGTIPELEPVKPLLEGFIFGPDDSKLGDCAAALLKALANAPSREPVAALVRGAGAELLELLPQAVPDVFSWDGGLAIGVAEHRGVKCAGCSVEPIMGPRFLTAGAEGGMDLCGECFAFHTFEEGEKFDCHFMPEGIKGFHKGKGKEKGKGPKGKGLKGDKGSNMGYWMPSDFALDSTQAEEGSLLQGAPASEQEKQAAQGTPVLMLQGKTWQKGGKRRSKGDKGKSGWWRGQADQSGWAAGAGDAVAPTDAAADPTGMPAWGYGGYWSWVPGYEIS